jgi:hypothetical protein
MDAFYVNVELQRRPELRGRPMVVAGNGPRAVVTTASYEARRFGIFSATPAERARRLCPHATFIPPDFDAYRARSCEVMDVLRAHVERVEVVGLDEAYLDLSAFERPRAAAKRVKAAVTEKTGPGCSIGIGPNKLVAKVASPGPGPFRLPSTSSTRSGAWLRACCGASTLQQPVRLLGVRVAGLDREQAPAPQLSLFEPGPVGMRHPRSAAGSRRI